jgi:hypothetical protein
MNIQMSELYGIGIRDNIVFFQLLIMVCFNKILVFSMLMANFLPATKPWFVHIQCGFSWEWSH